jgi:hypothetical protein
MAMALALLFSLILILLPSVLIVSITPHWRTMVFTVIGLEILGWILLGIPGAIFLEPTEALMVQLGKSPMSADSAWRLAIVYSFLIPLGLIPTWLVMRSIFSRHNKINKLIIFSGLYFVVAWSISILAHIFLL